MDELDYCRPFYPIECDNIFLRWTVGFYPKDYRGRRMILAWFHSINDAHVFLESCRRDHPNRRYDLFETIF